MRLRKLINIPLWYFTLGANVNLIDRFIHNFLLLLLNFNYIFNFLAWRILFGFTASFFSSLFFGAFFYWKINLHRLVPFFHLWLFDFAGLIYLRRRLAVMLIDMIEKGIRVNKTQIASAFNLWDLSTVFRSSWAFFGVEKTAKNWSLFLQNIFYVSVVSVFIIFFFRPLLRSSSCNQILVFVIVMLKIYLLRRSAGLNSASLTSMRLEFQYRLIKVLKFGSFFLRINTLCLSP